MNVGSTVTGPARRAIRLTPGWATGLPSALALALAAFAPVIGREPVWLGTFLGAAGALLMWSAALYALARRSGRALPLAIVLHRHHWVQACAQGTVLLYWGWHARIVYAFLPFILAQLIFAYAFDCLLTWSRRKEYVLGFGPFPIVFSINLFLWFRLDWFYWDAPLVYRSLHVT